MVLLERETQREILRKTLDQVHRGHGYAILVSGEAGVGKTSFIEDFTSPFRASGGVYWGACDPLYTPRPLGPLYDIALQKIPGLYDLLNSGANWLAVAHALLKSLQDNPAVTIVVIEDVHWADEATLDLLKFLGRRIDHTHSLLILTYREDEVGGQRALWETLGNFPAEHTVRLPLEPLSESAVEVLAAKANRPSKGIYSVTKGNPFFVTEVLRSKDEQIPETVRDAVLTRAARLSASARDVLELVSIIPGSVQLWLLESIIGLDAAAIDACVEGGFLVPSGNALSFRHELSRLAISESILISHSRKLHRKILRALQEHESEVPIALFVHHAVGAEDEKMILKYAPQAAREASHHGAHREAARHYQITLNYSQLLSTEAHAQLLDELSFEYYLTGQMEQAIQLREEAIRHWRQSQQDDRTGEELRWLSRLYWFQGDKHTADQFSIESVDLLEKLPPSRELAMAYSNRSQLYMLSEETQPAIEWGNRALKLAEIIKDDEIIVHALTNIGTAELLSGEENGLNKLVKALSMAEGQDMDDHVARCYANISSSVILHRDYSSAIKYLDRGITYTTDRDMDSYSIYLRGWKARMHFEQGAWTEAIREAQEVLQLTPGSVVMALPAVTTLGYVKMRQGDPEAISWLNQALEMALPTGELQRIGPVAVARAEAAWWEGDQERVLQEVSTVYKQALKTDDAWQLGYIAFWIWKAGGKLSGIDRDTLRGRIPLCFLAMIEGEPHTAAVEWERIGCPYEKALALAEGNVEDQFAALEIFKQLGAQPAARALQEKMRIMGIKGFPRGPRPVTKANPEGLTAREMEVLSLLVEGLRNSEIADRLSISLKTVDHHVSTILAKLQVHSRLEAAAVARQMNIFPRPK